MAFELPIEHFSKHVPWGGASGDADIIEMGVNLTGAAFAMNFATANGGTPIAGIALTTATAGSQGVSVTYDADYVHPETGEVIGASTIRPQIDEASLEALTWGADPSAPLVLRYDLLVTPSGTPQEVYCYGTFTLHPGIGD